MIETPSLAERVQRVPIVVRVLVVLVVAVVLVEIVNQSLDRSFGGNPSGRPGSSYTTATGGLAAYADLLRHYGHPVTRQRGDLTDGVLPAGATLVILDPDVLTENDAGVALQHVVNGGRLIVGGKNAGRYLRLLRDKPPKWTTSADDRFHATQPPFDTAGTVETAGDGAWSAPGSSDVVMGPRDNALLTHEHVGRGDMWFVADASLLTNQYLDRAGNAAFGLLLAGERGQGVVFAEGVHGFAEKRGFAAIPGRWKWMFLGIALAVIVFAWARGHRLGPPEDAERPLPPARGEYVDALATTLERTRDPVAATAPVRGAVYASVVQRAALRDGAKGADLERAARAVGLADDEVRVLVHGVATDEDVVVLGRALARTENWSRGRDG